MMMIITVGVAQALLLMILMKVTKNGITGQLLLAEKNSTGTIISAQRSRNQILIVLE